MPRILQKNGTPNKDILIAMKQEEGPALEGMAGPPPTRIGQSFHKVFCKSSVKAQDEGLGEGEGKGDGEGEGRAGEGEGRGEGREAGGQGSSSLLKKPRISLELCRAEPGEEEGAVDPRTGRKSPRPHCLVLPGYEQLVLVWAEPPREETVLGQPHTQAGVCPGSSHWGHGVGLGQQRGSCFSGWQSQKLQGQELSPRPSCRLDLHPLCP